MISRGNDIVDKINRKNAMFFEFIFRFDKSKKEMKEKMSHKNKVVGI